MTPSSAPVPGPARPLALVTGASSGIGAELARCFAEAGHDLVVVAEDDELASAAAQLRLDGAEVEAVQADLRRPGGVEQVWAAVQALRPLDAAALNAGIGLGGAFVEQDLADALSLVDLNVRSTTHLAHLVLRQMAARGAGRVLVTSSIASTVPGPYQAVYNATKSYLQCFVEALQSELADSPVTLTSLMPGPTDTEFFGRAGAVATSLLGRAPKDDPAEVARQGFEALMAGRRKVVAASLMSKVMALTDAVTPDVVKAAAHKVGARPRP